MSAQHTPGQAQGPWEARGGVLRDANGNSIASGGNNRVITGDVLYAALRLAAAAPRLLAECQAARRMLQRVFELHTEWVDDGEGDSRSVEAAIDRLDEVIAAATGGAL